MQRPKSTHFEKILGDKLRLKFTMQIEFRDLVYEDTLLYTRFNDWKKTARGGGWQYT